MNNLQIKKCPCGHDAQLWEKVIGGEPGKRYLCFTRDKKVKDFIHIRFYERCTDMHMYMIMLYQEYIVREESIERSIWSV